MLKSNLVAGDFWGCFATPKLFPRPLKFQNHSPHWVVQISGFIYPWLKGRKIIPKPVPSALAINIFEIRILSPLQNCILKYFLLSNKRGSLFILFENYSTLHKHNHPSTFIFRPDSKFILASIMTWLKSV